MFTMTTEVQTSEEVKISTDSFSPLIVQKLLQHYICENTPSL